MTNGMVAHGSQPLAEDPGIFPSRLLELLSRDAPLQRYEEMIAEIRARNYPAEIEAMLMNDVGTAIRVREEFDNKRKRERELSALYETARDLSSLRDTDHVLRAIVRRARQLVGTDIAYLSAADDERGDFYVRATEGVVSQDFGQIRVARNIGICGNVAATRTPFYSSNYSRDLTFDHEADIDVSIRGEGIVSILGIPLEVESKVIGVLFVGDRYERAYAPQEMAVLSSLGTFAALAIENARLLEEARRSLSRARSANDELRA
jgi:GAF domain-containing protein